jgi:DNA polymerase-4/DNA polymerase V
MKRPLSIHGFPRAILHIDGDAFFASCEQSRDPTLKGRAVITGKERGIVASMSYEAKARGITRGMRLFEVRALCPDAVILPSDYETYSILSERLFAIVRRYTPDGDVQHRRMLRGPDGTPARAPAHLHRDRAPHQTRA